MKRIHRIFVLSLAIIMLITAFCPIGAAAAENGSITISYDGKPLTFSNPNCFVQKDRYYLAPAEELASLTGWGTEIGADSVKFTNEALDLVVQANIGVKKFIINDQERVTEGAAEVINGVVMVPVDDFFHAMNCSVKWDEFTGTFTVKSPLARVFTKDDIIIHKTQTAPVIDGAANDAAWVGAEQTGDFKTVYYNNKPKSDTQFKVTYDDNAVYFFINCEGKPVPLEGISLLLATADTINNKTPLFNAVLIPEPGNTTPADGKNRKDGLRIKYNSDVEYYLNAGTDFDARYVVTDTSWTAEVKIPYNKLVAPSDSAVPAPANAAEWRFNISRVRPFTETASSWVPIRNSIFSDNFASENTVYSVYYHYAPTTNTTGSIFFEGYPKTSVFDGAQVPYLAIVPQNAGLRYMGYDTKLFYFDKPEDLSDEIADFNVKKSNFRAEWIAPSGDKYQAEIFRITQKGSRIYFSVRHPSMSIDGLYRLNIYIDKNNYSDKGAGKAGGLTTGQGNMVKKFEMLFDRQQVMDAGAIFNSWAVSPVKNKIILPNTNLKESEQSDLVKNLIAIIPETMGFQLNGSPAAGSFSFDPETDTLTQTNNGVVTLKVTRTKNADGTVTYETTPENYKDNGCLTVTSKTGKRIDFNYYQDANGNRYFLDEQLNRYARDYIAGKITSLATSDPLGAAYVLYEVAKAYQDWVIIFDNYSNAYPLDPSWGPPYGYFGGILNRWNFEELGGLKNWCSAYSAIRGTNALDIVSSQVGEDAQELLIQGMFNADVEFNKTYPDQSHNMQFKNWQGLISVSRATGDPDYIHQAIDSINTFAKGNILLDGFWKEVTVSYHRQSTDNLFDTLDNYLKGWSDPIGYLSPRTGVNIQNLDMGSWYPVLGASRPIKTTLVFPNGNFYPIQDTWTTTNESQPVYNLSSVLMPAANIARISKGTGTNTSQLYMTYAPQYGAHYHYDPLSLALYSNGQALLPDLGYTHTKFRSFAISTLGHNTVVVDSKDAAMPASANYGGKTENYADIDSTVQIMKANQENAYPGINEYDREPWYIKMEGSNNTYVLDIFRVDGGSRHEYTLNGSATSKTVTFTSDKTMAPYNQDSNTANNDAGRLLPEGTVVTLPTSEPETGKAVYNGQELYHAYMSVEDVRKADLADGKYVITMATKDGTTNKAGMKITGFAGGSSELFIGKVPSLKDIGTGTSPAATNYTPKMVVRREGTNLQSTFVNVMEPYAAGSSSKIASIDKLETANPKDVAMKINYSIANGRVNVTDLILSSSDPTVPLTVGDVTLTGKMAFIRYINGALAKVYTVEAESIVANGENIAGEGKFAGKVISTMRKVTGDNINAVIVDTAVTDAAVGKKITITHPDGSVNAFEVANVTPQGMNTIIELKDYDPGFEINPDGSSIFCYYPLTKWASGDHTFNISLETVTDYGLCAQRTKQRATLYTQQERSNALSNISKGYAWAVAAKNSAVAAADTYAARTNEELWNMVTPESINTDMDTVLQNLRDAYLYTGDAKYARKGLILLDRIADIYPDVQFNGTTQERNLEQTLIKAYDAFYPVVDDDELVTFLTDKAAEIGLHNLKLAGDHICKNIEDRILRQVRIYSNIPGIMDNSGIQQAALALAAVVLDNPPETTEWLDFCFKAGGGNVSASLVDSADRDGMGPETSPSYNQQRADMLAQIADALDGYDNYTAVDLYQNPAYIKTLTALYPLSAVGKYTVQTGESGTAGVPGITGSMENLLKAFKKTGNPVLAQLAYYMNNNSFTGIHYGIFVQNAENGSDEVANIINNNGELKLDSTSLPGYGFSILRDGAAPYKEMRSNVSFNNMAKVDASVATNYFSNGATQLESTAPGNYLTYAFDTGNSLCRIEITPYKAKSYGIYDVYIDDVKTATIDFYGLTGVNSGIVTVANSVFTAGTHTIKFVCTGKSSVATNYKMGIMNLIKTEYLTQDDTQRDFWMYYGKTNTASSHLDQLDLGVHAYGLDLAPDLGNGNQSNNDWSSGTLSHNTVVVDNSNQQPAAGGNPLHFDNSGNVQVMDAESSSAYQQAQTYRRSEVMVKVSEKDSYSVDFFRVKGGNDHTYSFHSMAGADAEEGLNLSQAENIDNQLVNVKKDLSPSGKFSVDYNVNSQQANDIHLRMTMLGEYNDVSLADYTAGNMDYVLAHRTGTGLESVFTSVVEPYKGTRYIQSIDEVAVTKDGAEVSDMEARAVKVTLTSGRVDYIISATDNTVAYKIDGKIDFKGIIGVYSEMNGVVVTSYVNDGTVIGAKVYDTGAVTGTVTGFTRELASQNQISVTLSNAFDANLLVGKCIYVQNDGVQNGMYRIKGIISQDGNNVTFDLGTTTLIRSYADSANLGGGFIYNIAEGSLFSIPLGNMTSN